MTKGTRPKQTNTDAQNPDLVNRLEEIASQRATATESVTEMIADSAKPPESRTNLIPHDNLLARLLEATAYHFAVMSYHKGVIHGVLKGVDIVAGATEDQAARLRAAAEKLRAYDAMSSEERAKVTEEQFASDVLNVEALRNLDQGNEKAERSEELTP